MNDVNSPEQALVEREDIALSRRKGRPLRPAKHYLIEVLDVIGHDSVIEITDPVPTGRQILTAAGKNPAEQFMLLMVDEKGVLKEVNLDEQVDVYNQGVEQFIAFESDRLFYVSLNGQRFPWGLSYIQENVLRKIGKVPANYSIWLERQSRPDECLEDGQSVNLDEPGLEKLYTRVKSWQLNVQGVMVNSEQPTIIARDALEAAGFNPAKGWILVLKVRGEPKQVINMDDVIDLRTPGIEKLRLTPAEINNGEQPAARYQEFALLEKDTAYLCQQNYEWETRVAGARRWLIIHGYPLPGGYNHNQIDLAVDIPGTYPDAQLDMFYVFPALTLANGKGISQTQCQENILGKSYQRWSRHLNGSTRWDPLKDSVTTHLAVVEESILREVE